VDLSEDARQRVRLWVSYHSGDTVRFDTFRSGTDGRHASAAMNPPELAAYSPATEEVRILEAARISGTPKAKPGEAEKRQGISFGEHGASHKSLESAGFKSRQIPPAASIKLASIRLPLTVLKADRTDQAFAIAPHPLSRSGVSCPAPKPTPAAEVAATRAWETPRQTVLSPHSLGLQTPGTKDVSSEGIPNTQEESPVDNKLNRVHTRSLRNGAVKMTMIWLIGSQLKKN
jgi:hypothetical protein